MIEPRYSRNIGAITEKEQQTLLNSRVFIAGCGGLGGNLISEVLRIGIGTITAIDSDCFEESNLNRQLLSSEDKIGHSKADTAARYARSVNSSVSFCTKKIRLTEDNCDSLIAGHDLVLDALDNIESRRILARSCDRLGIPMVYGAIRGWTSQIGVFPAGKAEKRINCLYPDSATLQDKSSLVFTPALCASIQIAEAAKYLLHKDTALTDRILYIDLLENDYEEIPFFD